MFCEQGQMSIDVKANFWHKPLILAMLDADNTSDPIQKIALGNVVKGVFGQTYYAYAKCSVLDKMSFFGHFRKSLI